MRGDLEGAGLAEPAGQRAGQLIGGGLQPGVAERGQRRRAALTGDQGVQEPPPAGPEQVGDHARDLQQRVLEDLLDPVLVPDLVLGQPGPGPGQRPQIPHCLRRRERAAQHPPLVQLAQPHAVFPVAFAPAGQVPGVFGVDQPHLQAGRLGQVVPGSPVIGGALEDQPLDALAPQVVHQGDYRRVVGVRLPHRLPLTVRPAARHPGAHHPEPLGDIDRSRIRHHLDVLLGHLRALTAARACRSRRPGRGTVPLRALPSGHRRLASLDREPAGSCPGGDAGETESDRRARSDSTQPAGTPPAPD